VEFELEEGKKEGEKRQLGRNTCIRKNTNIESFTRKLAPAQLQGKEKKVSLFS